MPRWTKPELDATKVPTDLDIAWSAGIYEGEGTIHQGRVKGRRFRSHEIFVTQKDPEILYVLRDWFGGSVKFARCSTIPPEHQCHRWAACGDRARLFVALIYGRLGSRRRTDIDASGVLEFLRGVSPIGLDMDHMRQMIAAFSEERYSQNMREHSRRMTGAGNSFHISSQQSTVGKKSEVQERVM